MVQKVKKYSADARNEGSSEVVIGESQFLGQRYQPEDPVANFIARYYNIILVIVALALIAWFGTRYYQQQNLNVSKAGGEILASVQSAFEDVSNIAADSTSNEDKAKREQALRSLKGGIKSLSEAVAPYPQMAEYYQAISQLELGEIKPSNVKFIFNSGYAAGDQRFFQELQDLTVAKYLLDLDLVAGKKALQQLVDKGEFVAAAAVSVLARLATTAEEKQSALKQIAALSKRQPEVAGQLETIKKSLQ